MKDEKKEQQQQGQGEDKSIPSITQATDHDKNDLNQEKNLKVNCNVEAFTKINEEVNHQITPEILENREKESTYLPQIS